MLHLRKTPFAIFVFNISGRDFKRFKSFVTIIGFLLHRYQIPSKMKVIIFLDQTINELNKVSGGVGKSLLAKSIGFVRSVCDISGKNFKHSYDHKYQNADEHTNIICINDLKQNEDIENFFVDTTDVFTINPKHKKEIVIQQRYMPKFLFTSNYVMRRPDGYSSARRMLEAEFSDYYGSHRTVQQDFNHHFFDEWNDGQWSDFYMFLIFCVSYYLKYGLIQPPAINLNQRLLISEVGLELIEFLDEKFLLKPKHHKKELYKEFVTGGYINNRYNPTQRTFTIKLKKYLDYKNISYKETPTNTKAYIEIISEDDPIHYTVFEDVDTDYRTVDSLNKMTRLVNKMVKYFEKPENTVLALDFETTGKDPLSDVPISLALSFEPKTGYNIILSNNPTKRNELIKPLLPFLQSESITKVFHNAKFDLKFMWKLGIKLSGNIHDTMVMDYLYDPTTKAHGLKKVSMRHLNYKMITFEEMTNGRTINEVETKRLTNYAVEDADITLQLYQFLTDKLK